MKDIFLKKSDDIYLIPDTGSNNWDKNDENLPCNLRHHCNNSKELNHRGGN
jgi:hypothetical protein